MSVVKIVPPRCADCKCRTERVITELVAIGQWREFFLCASCEYLRSHPDAARAIPAPRAMRPAKLQAESLLDELAVDGTRPEQYTYASNATSHTPQLTSSAQSGSSL